MTAPLDPFALLGAVLDGKFRVDEVVGEGGFGVVYRGWHLSFEQPIAVKVLKVPYAVDAQTQQAVLLKFREEAKLYFVLSQASLNIVRAIDFGAVDTPSGVWAPFMVLEWLEGRSLSTELQERRDRRMRGRSLSETMTLLEPAARGLAYIHSKRVAHRDVKPGNLFLTTLPGSPPEPTIKLLDFGIAKVISEGAKPGSAPTHATAFSSFTPFYAAPEQFDPRLSASGPWTDVYAFALVLTEVLTDLQAVPDDSAVGLIAAATDPANRPTPRARGAKVSDAVEGAFLRALAVDPKARFPDAGAFWAALTEAARAARAPAVDASRVTADMSSVASPKLSTATARMSRPSAETAPMPASPRPITAPMPTVQPRPGSSPAIATPPPMSAQAVQSAWGGASAPLGSSRASRVQAYPPSPPTWVAPGAGFPVARAAPPRPQHSGTALGCLVGVALSLAVAALLGFECVRHLAR